MTPPRPTVTPMLPLKAACSSFVLFVFSEAVTFRSLAAFSLTLSPSTPLPWILMSSFVEVMVTSPFALTVLPSATFVVLRVSDLLFSLPMPIWRFTRLSLAFFAFSLAASALVRASASCRSVTFPAVCPNSAFPSALWAWLDSISACFSWFFASSTSLIPFFTFCPALTP